MSERIIIVLEKRKGNNLVSRFFHTLIRQNNHYVSDFFSDFRRSTFYKARSRVKSLEKLLLTRFNGLFIIEVNKEKVGKKKFRTSIEQISKIDFLGQNDDFELWSLNQNG